MSFTSEAFLATAEAVARIGDPDALDDESLLDAPATVAAHRQQLDAIEARIAGAVAHRSRYELGYAGLAQRSGHRTPEALIQATTGVTRAEAIALVNVGSLIAETEAADALAADPDTAGLAEAPWQAGIARATAGGALTVAAAEAIRAGLGDASAAVTGTVLASAATELVERAGGLTPEQLRRRAREIRDDLDADGVADREREQQNAQYLKLWRQADGMFRGSLLLDAENGAYLTSVIDEITNPRRGGPRFVKAADKARADTLIADPRSTERIAAESLIELVRIGAHADPGRVFGSRKPAVRIVVTRETITNRTGHGTIELTGDPVSIPTIDRHTCDAGTVTITIDQHGQCLDVGREQRLFTARQRIGLAIRDGGCRWPGCDRPASWTEAHHIDHWVRDHGETNTADGVLLCRHHHMLLHNNHWQILRRGTEYWLRPPPTEDPHQTLRPMPSKSPLSRQRDAARQRKAEHHDDAEHQRDAEHQSEPGRQHDSEHQNEPGHQHDSEHQGEPGHQHDARGMCKEEQKRAG